jgi:hypothetical protein
MCAVANQAQLLRGTPGERRSGTPRRQASASAARSSAQTRIWSNGFEEIVSAAALMQP